MNIIEAAKSGRPFRRTDVGNTALWLEVDQHGAVVYGKDTHVGPGLTTEMLSATYEIKEPTVTITSSQFIEAMDYVLGSFNEFGDPIARCAMHSLAHKLGLEP